MNPNQTHDAKVTLSHREWVRYKQLMVTHKAIYRKGLDAYEQERKAR
jgi:hypothetical protein